jgi:hypothetical protein
MKNLLPILAIGAGVLLLTRKGRKEPTYNIPAGLSPQLPQGGVVAKSDMYKYGFVEFPLGSGMFYHQTQFQPTSGQVDTNSQNWLQTLLNAIQTGEQIFTIVSSTGLIPQITRSISLTSQTQNSIGLNVKFGTEEFVGQVGRTTEQTIVSDDGKYLIRIVPQGSKTVVNLNMDSGSGIQTVKTASFDWNTRQAQGFDSISGTGNVYISGIGQIYYGSYPKSAKVVTQCVNTEGLQPVYSTSKKGACSYYGGAKKVLVRKDRNYVKTKRQGTFESYPEHRKAYKRNWEKKNRRKSVSGIITL